MPAVGSISLIDVAHQRGFARARQTHDAEDLAPCHLERGPQDAHDAAKALEHFGLAYTLRSDRCHRLVGAAYRRSSRHPSV